MEDITKIPEVQQYLINFNSAIRVLTAKETDYKDEIVTTEGNLEITYNSLSAFTRSKKQYKQEAYAYCNRKISEAKKLINTSSYKSKKQRIEMLSEIEVDINEIFSKSVAASLENGKGKTNSLTVKETILVLYYSGMLNSLTDISASAKARLLSKLFGLDYQNAREALGQVEGRNNKVKTKANLDSVIRLFKELKLPQYSDRVLPDLEKSSKKL